MCVASGSSNSGHRAHREMTVIFKLLCNSLVATQKVLNFNFPPFRNEMQNFHTDLSKSQNKTDFFSSSYCIKASVVTPQVPEMYVGYPTAYSNGLLGYCVNGLHSNKQMDVLHLTALSS